MKIASAKEWQCAYEKWQMRNRMMSTTHQKPHEEKKVVVLNKNSCQATKEVS